MTFIQPEAWHDILDRKDRQFRKDPVWSKELPGIPNHILSEVDAKKHSKMRKLLAPGFTSGALKSQEPILHRYVNLLIERLNDLTIPAKDHAIEVNIAPWLNFTTFDIFGDLGFGESFDCLQQSRYHKWIATVFESVKLAHFIAAVRYYPWLDSILMQAVPPSLKNKQLEHYGQIVAKVERRLNWELQRPDIMAHIIEQGYEDKGMTRDELNSTFMILRKYRPFYL